MKKIKTTNIRLPRDLWLRLRRLQEEGKVASIQAATVEALTELVEKLEGEK